MDALGQVDSLLAVLKQKANVAGVKGMTGLNVPGKNVVACRYLRGRAAEKMRRGRCGGEDALLAFRNCAEELRRPAFERRCGAYAKRASRWTSARNETTASEE